MLTSLWEDLRYAARLLARQPGFTAASVLLLALGIGANGAIFSLVDSVLLKPLPYRDLDRLYYIQMRDTIHGGPPAFLSVPELIEFEGQARSISHFAGLLRQAVTVTVGAESFRVSGAFVSKTYFDTLGIQIARGRPFLPEEYAPGRNQAVLLPESFWRSRLGADPSVVGRTLRIDSEIHTIAGILPAMEGETRGADLYLPLPFTPQLLAARDGRTVLAVARLAPGATPQQAQAELHAASLRIAAAHPDSNAGMEATLVSVMDDVRHSAGQPLVVLAAAVTLVLLITCSNLAGLLLVRASGRRKEIAIRTALGASQGRIFRQMITESLLLALLGGAAGVAVAAWGVHAIKNWGALALPRLQLATVGARALFFTAFVSLAAGFLFGSAPALQALRLSLTSALNEESRGSSGGRARSLTRSLLVVAEVALSVILLVAAGLLLRTFAGLTRLDLGFAPDRVLTMRVVLPAAPYSDDSARSLFIRRVVSRLSTLPGVAAAGGASVLPLTPGDWRCQFVIDGSGAASPETASYNAVDPGYFDSIGAPILAGRPFSPADTAGSPPVVIVSQAFASRYFPGQNAVGRSLTLNLVNRSDRATIVGVVRNFVIRAPDEPPLAVIYQPHAQRPWPAFTFTIRSAASGPSSLAAAARGVVREIDSEVPVDHLQPLSSIVARALSGRQLAMVLLTAFAALAVLLAAVGIYGVLAVSVSHRGREFGIRMALGASPPDVLSLVFKEGLALTAAGLAGGLAAAPLATYALRQMLYGVTFFDPLTFAAVAALILLIGAAACLIPARRAARTSPACALRE
jgi:putative ABC transport system permease protein